MPNVIKQLLNAGSVTLLCDYRRGDAVDMSGLGRTGVITAPVTFDRNGAHFSGVGRIMHPDHVSGRNTTGSIIVLAQSFFSTAAGYVFDARDAGNSRIWCYNTASSLTWSIFSTVGGSSLTWPSFAETRCLGINYASGQIPASYKNGNFAVNGTVALTTISALATPFTVGNNYAGSTPTPYTIAAIIETNVQLSAQQHAQIYSELARRTWGTAVQRRRYFDVKPRVQEAGLAAAWDGDAFTLNVPLDVSGNGINGYIPTGLCTDNSPVGRCFNLLRPEAQFRHSAALGCTAQLTVEALVKPTTLSNFGASNIHAVASAHGNAGYLTLGGVSATTYVVALSNLQIAGVSRDVFGTTTMPINTWVHIVGTYDGDKIRVYVNGVLDGTSISYPGALTSWTTGTGTIGAYYGVAGSDFTGYIKYVKISNVAKSAEQVRQLYDASGLKSIGTKSGWGVPISTAVRGGTAGQYLESSGWQFGDTVGRWQITTSTIQGKVVKALLQTTSSAAGPEYGLMKQVHNLGEFSAQERAFGTWEWSFYCATRSSYRVTYFNAAATSILSGATKYDAVAIGPTNSITLFTYCIPRVTSAADYVVNGNWYRFKVTRTPDSVYTVWIRGGAYVNWTIVTAFSGATSTVQVSYAWMATNEITGAAAANLWSLGSADGDYAMTWKPFI